MPELQKIADYIAAEWAVISSAPLTFISQTFVIGVVVWLIQRWVYGTVISHRDGRISHLEERLKMRDDQLNNKLQTTTPSEAQELIKTLQAQLDGMKPRRLTDQQKKALATAAIARGGDTYSLAVVREMGSADAEYYAEDLLGALSNLQGWKISAAAAMGLARKAPSGLGLCVSETNSLSRPERIIFDVLQSAGLEFDLVQLKLPDAHVGIQVTNRRPT